jgi:hypothetical protein
MTTGSTGTDRNRSALDRLVRDGDGVGGDPFETRSETTDLGEESALATLVQPQGADASACRE